LAIVTVEMTDPPPAVRNCPVAELVDRLTVNAPDVCGVPPNV
jgi:hypothetical protein